MTAEELAAIEARCTNASLGPWHTVKRRAGFGDPIWHILLEDGREVIGAGNYGEGGGIHGLPDATFISAVRQDIPALLTYIRELEAR